MSALGQKQTCAVQKGMSALPPIATAKADCRKGSCLLYSRKRTCAAHSLMSALGQKRTNATQDETRIERDRCASLLRHIAFLLHFPCEPQLLQLLSSIANFLLGRVIIRSRF